MTHDINELVRQDKAVRVGPDVFHISKHELRTIKKAVKYMYARPRKRDWLQIAARPLVAKKLVSLIDDLGVEMGCEVWGRENLSSIFLNSGPRWELLRLANPDRKAE